MGYERRAQDLIDMFMPLDTADLRPAAFVRREENSALNPELKKLFVETFTEEEYLSSDGSLIRVSTAQRITVSQESIEQRFNRLSAKLRRDTAVFSTLDKRIRHPAYQEIIGMGADVVPLLIKDLESERPSEWFVALTKITGNDQVPPEDRGNWSKMVKAWSQWHRSQPSTK